MQSFRPKLGLFGEKVLFVEKLQKVLEHEFFLAPGSADEKLISRDIRAKGVPVFNLRLGVFFHFFVFDFRSWFSVFRF